MCYDHGFTCIFAYGSLIWRPGFPFVRKIFGYVKGYKRRFWLSCTNHRGTKEKPGRVATIVKSDNENDIVWGVCYFISSEQELPIIEALDVREKGYKRLSVPIYTKLRTPLSEGISNNGIVEVLAVATSYLYVASEDTPGFVKGSTDSESSLREEAKVISTSCGKSGPNRDYLFNLCGSLSLMGICDDYLLRLEKLVKQYVDNFSDGGTSEESSSSNEQHPVFKKKFYLATIEQSDGTLLVDTGAVQAISQLGRSLLPCGIKDVKGSFGKNCIVSVKCCVSGKPIAKAFTNYSSDQIMKIKGKHSSKISRILEGESKPPETVIEQDNMILL